MIQAVGIWTRAADFEPFFVDADDAMVGVVGDVGPDHMPVRQRHREEVEVWVTVFASVRSNDKLS